MLVFLQGKLANPKQILSVGLNEMGDNQRKIPGIHAEHNCMLKLPNNPHPQHGKKRKKVNMLILRMNKMGKLQPSKPCARCIEKIQIYTNQKGYKIKNIYYSDQQQTNLAKTTITELSNDMNKHHSIFDKSKPLN